VLNTSTRAHHLNVANADASRIPKAVAMGYRTVADIRDDFDVRVGMGKPLFGAISIVPEAQRPTRI
jgi:hypothetical protein